MLIIVVLMSAFEVFLIHSRSGVVLFTASIIFCYFELLSKKYKKQIIAIGILIGGIIILFGFSHLYNVFVYKIINGNESSNGARILLLGTSVNEVWKMSPIWGMGIKRFLHEGYPLGSHSTYVGFFYKTGFLGLIIGAYIFIESNCFILKRIRKSHYIKSISLFIVSLIVLFALEDVDGANWCIIVYFTLLITIANTVGMRCKKYYNGVISVDNKLPQEGISTLSL